MDNNNFVALVCAIVVIISATYLVLTTPPHGLQNPLGKFQGRLCGEVECDR